MKSAFSLNYYNIGFFFIQAVKNIIGGPTQTITLRQKKSLNLHSLYYHTSLQTDYKTYN